MVDTAGKKKLISVGGDTTAAVKIRDVQIMDWETGVWTTSGTRTISPK